MLRTSSIQWKFIFGSLAGAAVVFAVVFAAPYYTLVRAPILISAVCILALVSKRGKTSGVEAAVLGVAAVLTATTLLSVEVHRSSVWAYAAGCSLVLLLLSRQVMNRWLTTPQFLLGLLGSGLLYQTILTGNLVIWVKDYRRLFPGESVPLTAFRFEMGNTWAAYLIPVIMLQIGLFFSVRRIWARWLLAAGAAWSLVLFYVCSSRGGMIGLGAAVVCFAVVEWRAIREWILPGWQGLARRKWLPVSLGLLVLVGAAFGGWVLFQAVESHPTHGSFGFGARAGFWIPAWQAFLGSPLWGNGFFTEAGYYLATVSAPPDSLYYISHNLYLDILQGMGLLGAAVVGVLIIAVWGGLWRARGKVVQQTPDNARQQLQGARAITMAALPVLVGFLIHNVFDTLYLLPLATIPLIGSALAFDDHRLKVRLPAVQITSGLVLFAAWGLYFVQQPYLSAINNARFEDWQQTAVGLDQSMERLPGSPVFQREAGYAWAEAAAQGESAALEKAVSRFEAAVERDPNFAPNWLNLGALQRASGDLTGSRSSLEAATEKAWKWGLAWLNLGEVCEQQGDEGCARQAYLKALEREPDWVSDPYWQESPLRASASAAAKAVKPDGARQEPLEMEKAIQQPYMLPVLKTAKKKIETGELDDAERLLKLAPMLFIGRESELIELHWLDAELAAAQGAFDKAAELGLAAREEFETNRLNDTIAAGVNTYGSGIYQLPTLEIDLVPQVTWMQFPGDWQQRMVRLAYWQE